MLTGTFHYFHYGRGVMMSYPFTSSIAHMIQEFLDFKYSLGYKYSSGGHYLHALDRFCEMGGYPSVVSKELIENWIMFKEDINPTPYRSWISPIREFGKYLQLTGYPDAYIVSDKFIIKKYHSTPYFFTNDEISVFFAA